MGTYRVICCSETLTHLTITFLIIIKSSVMHCSKIRKHRGAK